MVVDPCRRCEYARRSGRATRARTPARACARRPQAGGRPGRPPPSDVCGSPGSSTSSRSTSTSGEITRDGRYVHDESSGADAGALVGGPLRTASSAARSGSRASTPTTGRRTGVQPPAAARRGCRRDATGWSASTASRACSRDRARPRADADGSMLVAGHHLRRHRARGGRARGWPRRATASRACSTSSASTSTSRSRSRTAASRSSSRARAPTGCSAAPSPTRRWSTGTPPSIRRTAPTTTRSTARSPRARTARSSTASSAPTASRAGCTTAPPPPAPRRVGRGQRHRLGRHRAAAPRGRPASAACARCSAPTGARAARAEAELRARTDELTGTFNRRHFAQIAAEALAADARPLRPAAARRRPLQADQRRLRPRRRRRGARRARAPARAALEPGRLPGPLGRRGVRRAAARCRAPTTSSRGGPSACAAPSATAPIVAADVRVDADHLDRARASLGALDRRSTRWSTRPTAASTPPSAQGRNRVLARAEQPAAGAAAAGARGRRHGARAGVRRRPAGGRPRGPRRAGRTARRADRRAPRAAGRRRASAAGSAGWLHDVGKVAIPSRS